MSSLRMPQNLSGQFGFDTGESVLNYELMEEKAHSLGRAGRKVEAALANLRDAEGSARAAALKAAADAVWSFFVQREVLGLRDRKAIIEQFGIPREVLARLGAT
jgi:hypothetical protein